MKMKALSPAVSAFSYRLTSVCLRYGVAKPSVWPCRRACNPRQFSDFRSDSPLTLTLFWFRFGDVAESLRVFGFLVPQSIACKLPASALESWTSVRCSSIRFSCRFPRSVSGRKSCVNQLSVSARSSHDLDTPMTLTKHRQLHRLDVERWCHTTSVENGQKGTDHVSKSRCSKSHSAVYN